MASINLDEDRLIVLSSTVYGDDSSIVRVFSRALGVVPIWVKMGKTRRSRGEGAKWHPLALLDARGLNRKGSEGLFRVRTADRLDLDPGCARGGPHRQGHVSALEGDRERRADERPVEPAQEETIQAR